MSTTEIYLIAGAAFIGISAFILILISFKWIILGLKVMFAKMRFKENAGFVLFLNKTGNIGRIMSCDISRSTVKVKKQIYPMPAVIRGTIFGLPYVFLNTDDVTRSAGIYYPSTTDSGEPLYYKDEFGKEILDSNGDKIPKITAIKEGASFDPDLMMSIIIDQALTSALKELFSKQTNILILVMIAAGAAGAAAFFGYDITQNQLPTILQVAQTAAQCGVVA